MIINAVLPAGKLSTSADRAPEGARGLCGETPVQVKPTKSLTFVVVFIMVTSSESQNAKLVMIHPGARRNLHPEMLISKVQCITLPGQNILQSRHQNPVPSRHLNIHFPKSQSSGLHAAGPDISALFLTARYPVLPAPSAPRQAWRPPLATTVICWTTAPCVPPPLLASHHGPPHSL